MHQISSTNNPIIKDAARLQRKRHRYERRQFLIEGEDLLEAALSRGVLPRQVFVPEELAGKVTASIARARRSEEAATAPAGGVPLELYTVSEPVLAKLSQLGSGTRLVAVFPFLEQPLKEIELIAGAGPLLYLAGVRDPGNVGTLIRSAAALGAAAVALGPGCADPYSAKALRGTMGAIFQLPLALAADHAELLDWAASRGAAIACADAHEGEATWQTRLDLPLALVLGAEREGVPAPLKQVAQLLIRIPQTAAAESLNVAMAGTALLYEALRQRSLT